MQSGREVCTHYLGHEKRLSVPDDLDATYNAWAADPERNKPADNVVCYGLGALLGQRLVSDLGFQWCMELAEDGEIYCVRHPKEWRIYPFDFVAKRIHEREPHGGFFRAIYEVLRKHNKT